MNPEDDIREDEQIAALLAALDADVPPPDPRVREDLRRRAAEVFASAGARAGSASNSTPIRRRSPMFLSTIRWAAAAATAASVAAVYFFFAAGSGADAAAPTLGKAMIQLADAKSVHAEVTIDGKTSDLWAKPGAVRLNRPGGLYTVARGGRTWQIDEKANQAAVQPVSLLKGGKLDVLAVVGLGQDAVREQLAAARPVQRIQRDNKTYQVYREDIGVGDARRRVECLVLEPGGMLVVIDVKRQQAGQWRSLAAVNVVGVDAPVAEDLFVVGDTLTEDGRVGKVTDAEGITAVRPAMGERWTPLVAGTLVMPGDWLRTDPRGANAVAARLVKDTHVTLGPGTLVEVAGAKQIRVHSGEVKIAAAKNAPVELVGPDKQTVKVAGADIFRVQEEKLVRLDREPLWLKGFEGKVVAESIGSLVANVEGRDTPLTVGYHKVSVDIRDQIARTVVEESFVNHTSGRLEGVFYFPLPQDASISGFGMWIGSELVEADVVEKQRAREIYETILRERRDPGLLEWTGGNIFKARVFPIEPHSEKRIKITYTQVLPLVNGSYRYSYALQSDMLKENPLRELLLDVRLSSAMTLKDVGCPSHLARIDRTPHSAHVEFTAQEYTPTRDFEVAVQVEDRQSDVVVIPHRRGEDGYFMLMLTPPALESAVRSDVLADGPPQDLLIVADTSASIDPGARGKQAELIAALLGSLTPKDTFNLACCDVETDWTFEKSVPATAENVAAARRFLANRISLGWTDLDKAFAGALDRAGAKTRIIYAGDGVPTTGDANPQSFVKRLRRLYEGRMATCYAVAVGSSFESGVMKAIASLGGGSARQIGGENTPQVVARELLAEFTRPALKDIKIVFRGLKTARVYPEELPNVAAGAQQIILGRYLPELPSPLMGEGQGVRGQEGEVVVSGTLDGKPVRYTAKISLKDAEQGNSFIPRLWARMHLDQLLAQGGAKAIQDEVIALSEEYHIITPYTSLLVLESDADRERFKVARRFVMRDGEKFFAEGRDRANFDLVQQQMKRAGTWRLGLRRQVLEQLGQLGREVPQLGHNLADGLVLLHYNSAAVGAERMSGSTGHAQPNYYGYGGGSRGEAGKDWGAEPLSRSEDDRRAAVDDLDRSLRLSDAKKVLEIDSLEATLETALENGSKTVAGKEKLAEDAPSDSDARDEGGSPAATPQGLSVVHATRAALTYSAVDLAVGGAVEGFKNGRLHDWYFDDLDADRRFDFSERTSLRQRLRPLRRGRGEIQVEGANRFRGTGQDYSYLIEQLFPVPFQPAPAPKLPEKRWPEEARKLSESLLRLPQLESLKAGLELIQTSESLDVRGATSGRSRALALVSRDGWLTLGESLGQNPQLRWADKEEAGAIGRALLLGAVRAAKADDLAVRSMHLPLDAHLLSPIEFSHLDHKVEVKRGGPGEALLVIAPADPKQGDWVQTYRIDTERHVVLNIEHRNQGKVTSEQRFGNFVEVAGAWWATQAEGFDSEGRRTSLATLELRTLGAPLFAERTKKELAIRSDAQLLRLPLPPLADAKKALAAGKASLEDRLVLLLHFAGSQQWTRVMEHLDAVEKLSGKPAIRWLRYAVEQVARKHQELKQRIDGEAAKLAAQPSADELFLASHVTGLGSGILETNEQLQLQDALRPVFARQPKYTQALKNWRQQRVNLLTNLGRYQEALDVLKELIREDPNDCGLHQQYAQTLVNQGDYAAAYAHLRKILDEIKWQPNEDYALRQLYAGFLHNQGRFDDLIEWTTGWIGRNPEAQDAYAMHLATLVRLDRIDEANKLMQKWIGEAKVEGKLAVVPAARLQASVSLIQGNGYSLWRQRIEPEWLDPLADVAIFFALHESHPHVADQIMGAWQFQQCDQVRRVRKWAAGKLAADVEKLRPAEVQRLTGWAMAGDPAVEQQAWRSIAVRLRKRWEAEKDVAAKNQLGGPLGQIYSARLTPEEWLDFLRIQWKTAAKEHRDPFAGQLFNALLGQPWKQEYEEEAFAMLGGLSTAEEAPWRVFAEVLGLHQLTDAMLARRNEKLNRQIEHPEKLTRTELRAKHAQTLKAAREGYLQRLNEKRQKREGPAGQWFDAERLYLEVLLERDAARLIEECWELLGARPVAESDDDGPAAVLGSHLRTRMLSTLAYLAVRKEKTGTGTSPQPPRADQGRNRSEPVPVLPPVVQADRLLKYIEAGGALEPQSLRWKALKYQVLVALDRPKDLQKALASWIEEEGALQRWRVNLAYLLAEQGKLEEAAKLFEAVAAADELGPAEYRTLATWYTVLGNRDSERRAKIAAYKVMEEYRLNQMISYKLRPWQNSGSGSAIPESFDEEVLLMFAALFEKSGAPQNHLWLLQQFYRETRDFRLLAGLADAVIGHTAGKAYPFLQSMSGTLSEIRDEATADSLVEQIAKVRKKAKTHVDQRALDVLEVQVERRASEVLNQPGPHVDRALAAMQRAFNRDWTPGEPKLMSDVLASLGRISQKPLADEQVRQLVELHKRGDQGTHDRLRMANNLAQAHWNYDRHNAAIDLLVPALEEYEAANGGRLPDHANDVFGNLISYYEGLGRFATGEKRLFEQLQRPVNKGQTDWLQNRLYELYERALRGDGEVSLGKGETLYLEVLKLMLADLDKADSQQRYNIVARITNLFRAARDKKINRVPEDVRAWAFQRMPKVLAREINNYVNIVNQVAQCVREHNGPGLALEFLLDRIETEPKWLRWNNQDGWGQHAWNLAQWRVEARQPANATKNIDKLEERLLRIVLAELRRDLRSRQQRSRYIYDRRYSLYWAEKEKDFARAAEEVYAEDRNSAAGVGYIAEFLFNGLNYHDRAIEMLLTAFRQNILEEGQQSQLVNYLHQRSRYGESIAVLLPLVEKRPDNIQYRVWLMIAYAKTRQPEQLQAALKAADEHFHKDGRWTEGNMAALAKGCLDSELFEQSAAYYKEVIALHQRTQPNRGIGNGTLSEYYRHLSAAHSGLGQTAEAVEAAFGAVVSWGPTHQNRGQALEQLKQVIRQAKDLDKYVAELDKKSRETKLENPVVRKALGQVYLERREFAKASEQLNSALEVQPNDAETHRALISCLDQQGRKEQAVEQVLAALRLLRRDIELYKDLGRRYEDLKDARQAERAYTSLVEMLVNESEGHAALAEIRQRQTRFGDAIGHWKEVARIRALEPTGLLKLAEAQLLAKQWSDAEATLDKLQSQTWPSRFSDVQNQSHQLRDRLNRERQK
ncbi:MAG: VIT domain-containing protein [Thermoguttaceae bacterium]